MIHRKIQDLKTKGAAFLDIPIRAAGLGMHNGGTDTIHFSQSTWGGLAVQARMEKLLYFGHYLPICSALIDSNILWCKKA